MKAANKITLFFGLGLILVAIISFVLFYLSVTDIKNITLNGYVYDERTKLPLYRVLVIINNDRYEDDNGNKNYDEYLGHDRIKLYTDKNGYYSTSINKSAFVWINLRKKGYLDKSVKGEYSNKVMKYKTYLKKNSKTSILDHFGSTSYVTDASGEVYQHLEYPLVQVFKQNMPSSSLVRW